MQTGVYHCHCVRDAFHRSERWLQADKAVTTMQRTLKHDRKMMFAIGRAVLRIPACYLCDVVKLFWDLARDVERCLMWLHVLIIVVLPHVVDIECFMFLLAWTIWLDESTITAIQHRNALRLRYVYTDFGASVDVLFIMWLCETDEERQACCFSRDHGRISNRDSYGTAMTAAVMRQDQRRHALSMDCRDGHGIYHLRHISEETVVHHVRD